MERSTEQEQQCAQGCAHLRVIGKVIGPVGSTPESLYMNQITLIAGAVLLIMLSGCSDSNSPNGSTDGSSIATEDGDSTVDSVSNNASVPGTGEPVADSPAADEAQQQAQNTDAFYQALRETLVRQKQFGADDDVPFYTEQFGPGPVLSGDVTGTNVQEEGVDEPDRMKSDGEFLYVLDNQFENPINIGYVAADSFTTTRGDTAAAHKLPRQRLRAGVATAGGLVDFAIEALPNSSVGEIGLSIEGSGNATTVLRILALQNEVPDAVPVTELQLDLNGGAADGMYLFNDNAQRNLIATSTSYSEHLDDGGNHSNRKASSLVSKIDITDATQASVAQSVKFDGEIISSRRIDDKLFVASRYYPEPGFNHSSMLPAEFESAVAEADLTQTLPKITNADGTTTDLINPAECFVVARAPRATNGYFTRQIVSMAVIDLKTLQLNDSECFLGYTEQLYVTPNSVYLFRTRWDYIGAPSTDIQQDDIGSGLENQGSDRDTEIHQFAINGTELTYSGSAVIAGSASTGKPYHMSEKDGYLRVATFSRVDDGSGLFSEIQNDSVTSIRLTVFDITGDTELVKVSELPNTNFPDHIGMSGSQLYASRFFGDRAYLATFGQTNSIYVIDLSDPEAPKLSGEIEIDGYHDYLQPIGENHLLGIGRDAVPGPVEQGAIEQGVKLSLFNIADANNPTEVQSVVIGERGTETAALQYHRTITIQPATASHPMRIAFGVDVHGLANPQPGDSYELAPWNYSGLHGFDINVGSGAGIEPLGVMVVNSASNPLLPAVEFGENNRSVIVGDAVYYIRSSEVFAGWWSNLGDFVGPR